jgi:hypothetical protein
MMKPGVRGRFAGILVVGDSSARISVSLLSSLWWLAGKCRQVCVVVLSRARTRGRESVKEGLMYLRYAKDCMFTLHIARRLVTGCSSVRFFHAFPFPSLPCQIPLISSVFSTIMRSVPFEPSLQGSLWRVDRAFQGGLDFFTCREVQGTKTLERFLPRDLSSLAGG